MSTSEPNDSQLAFDRVEQSYLSTWCRLHPEAALDAGVEAYADQLQSHDDETVGIHIVLNEKCLAALDEIDPTQLNAEQQLHYHILHGCADIEHHALMNHDWRHRQPSMFLPINAIHQLTIRPLEYFSAALKGRLSAIPHHLRDAKTYLSSAPALIPQAWLTMALSEAEAGIAYFQQLPSHPRVADCISDDNSIEQSLIEAIHALETYTQTLKRLAPSCEGEFACGRTYFERLLKQQHFLPITSQRLHEFGQRLFEETQLELEQELSRSELSLEAIQQHHPDAKDLLASYNK